MIQNKKRKIDSLPDDRSVQLNIQYTEEKEVCVAASFSTHTRSKWPSQESTAGSFQGPKQKDNSPLLGLFVLTHYIFFVLLFCTVVTLQKKEEIRK